MNLTSKNYVIFSSHRSDFPWEKMGIEVRTLEFNQQKL